MFDGRGTFCLKVNCCLVKFKEMQVSCQLGISTFFLNSAEVICCNLQVLSSRPFGFSSFISGKL